MHRTWDFREDDVEELKQAAAVQASDARGEDTWNTGCGAVGVSTV